MKRKGYDYDYEKIFDDIYSKTLNKSILDFRQTNTNYKKVDELVKKYDMTKWDKLAKDNQEAIDYFKKSL